MNNEEDIYEPLPLQEAASNLLEDGFFSQTFTRLGHSPHQGQRPLFAPDHQQIIPPGLSSSILHQPNNDDNDPPLPSPWEGPRLAPLQNTTTAAVAGTVGGTTSMDFNRMKQLFHEALAEVPLENKAAYLEGMRVAPQIVEKESFLELYARSNDFNFWAVTSKICRYWNERKRLFGSDRCYRPLTLTGNGALTKEDVRVLSAGFPSILPRLSTGHTVVLMDRRRWATVSANVPASRRHRCLFYMAKIGCEQVVADNTPGGVYILLVNLLLPRFQNIDERSVSTAYDFLSQAFPGKPRVHLVCKPPKAVQQWYLVQSLISRYVKLVERGCDFGHIELHLETEAGEIKRSLLEHNFTEDGIPTFVDGEWDFKSSSHWVRKQTILEREEEQVDKAEKLKHSTPEGEPTDPAARRRLLNAINSRKKRERRRQEHDILRKEHEELTRENKKLKRDAVYLNRMLDEALQLVGDLTTTDAVASSIFDHNPQSDRIGRRNQEIVTETRSESHGSTAQNISIQGVAREVVQNGDQSTSLKRSESGPQEALEKRSYFSLYTQNKEHNSRENGSLLSGNSTFFNQHSGETQGYNEHDLAAMEPRRFQE